MNQKIIEDCNSSPVGQAPVVRPPNNLQIPRFLMNDQSYTPLRQNPKKSIVETSSPAIQFENLPFFKILKPLIKPKYLKHDSAKFPGLYFNLSKKERQSIDKSWNIDSQEYKIKIILRLQQVGLNENVNKRLPYNITVTVNGDQCSLPTLNIPLTSEIIPWHNNDPIDITQHIDKKFDFQNRLQITWTEEQHKCMACVYMAQKLTWNDLLIELEKRPKRASDKTKKLILESMENDGDILVDSLIASVKDPLSKLRMKLPARGVDCTHLQCFDAIQFLQMNEQKQTWKCPICNNKIKYENIEIDELFLEIMQSKDLTEECECVVLFRDGTWSERKNREFLTNSRTNARRSINNMEAVTLQDFDDEDNSNRDQNNVDNVEIILKPKRFKNNPLEVEEINKRHQEKDKSRTVLSVITLD